MKTNKLGTNQHRIKPRYKFWKSVLFLLLLCLLVLVWSLYFNDKLISPVPKGAENYRSYVYEVYAKEEETPEYYIRQVFQKDADRALKIAKCESHLNPKAIGDSGKSIGLFQINQRWHKIEPRFLFNPKINIQVAYQLFKESGNFHLWSCDKLI